MQFQELAADLGLDIYEFTELVRLFLETARNDIRRIRGALESADAVTITETAHSLKGSAGNLGFAALSMEARKLEDNARNQRLTGITEQVKRMMDGLDALEQVLTGLQLP